MTFNLDQALAYELDERDCIITEGEPETPIDPWADQIFTLRDAYASREPLKYVIAGLFPRGSLSTVFGPPGSLKSMILGSFAVNVAAGMACLGRDADQSPVLWIDLDNGKRRTHERFEALGRGLLLNDDIPFYYVSMPAPWFNAGKIEDINALIKRVIDRNIRFIIIDNLGLISPTADENSDQMILVMGNLRLLAEQTGAAVVLIHHQRKTTGNNTRAGESLRGHSSIESAIDLALLVEREEGSDVITIKSTKTRDVSVPPFGAEFRFEHKPGTDELMEATFVRVDVEDMTSLAAIEKTILAIIKEQPRLNQKELLDQAKSELQAGVNLVRNVLEKMVKNKQIKTETGLRGAKLYVAK